MVAGSGGAVFIVIPAVQRWKPRLRDPPVLSFILLAAHGILVLQPGIEPMHPALEARSLNHWTAKEVPSECYNEYTQEVQRLAQNLCVLSYSRWHPM